MSERVAGRPQLLLPHLLLLSSGLLAGPAGILTQAQLAVGGSGRNGLATGVIDIRLIISSSLYLESDL